MNVKKRYPDVPIYSYGSSARGNTIITYAGLSKYIDACIDSSPLKWGTVNANTGLPIIAMSQIDASIDFVLYLAAWNFKEEILRILNEHNLHPKAILQPFPGHPRMHEEIPPANEISLC